MVFGGFSILLLYRYKANQKSKASKKPTSGINDQDLDNDEVRVLLSEEKGYILFEGFCQNEFSLENLYLFNVLNANINVTKSDLELIQLIRHIYDTFIKTRATHEVNISGTSRKAFLEAHKTVANNSIELQSQDSQFQDRLADVLQQLFIQVLINIHDTFYRFSITPEYKLFQQAKALQKDLKNNVFSM